MFSQFHKIGLILTFKFEKETKEKDCEGGLVNLSQEIISITINTMVVAGE